MSRCSSVSERMLGGWMLGLLIGACVMLQAPTALADDTLYDGLGGQVGLRRIVHGMLQKATIDPRISDKFQNINMEYLEQHLVDRLCAWTGGPCTVHGPTMKGAHAELNLTDRHFNALVEDLEASMAEAGTPYGVQNRLLVLLAPMHRDVVNH